MKRELLSSHRAILLLVDSTGGTLQGDPDLDNDARTDPDTGHGMATPMVIKRKVRDDLQRRGHKIYVQRGSCFERTDRQICESVGIEPFGPPTDEEDDDTVAAEDKPKGKKIPSKKNRAVTADEARKFYEGMSAAYVDARMFGQTVTKLTAQGMFRGPIQVSMGRSIDPITIVRDAITRCAVTTEAEELSHRGDNRTMGRRSYVPYGLYRFHIFANPWDAKNTLCTEEDYDLFLNLLPSIFDNDRSSTRPACAVQGLYEIRFRPGSAVNGERLLQGITVKRKDGEHPSRAFEDYDVSIPEKYRHSQNFDFRSLLDEVADLAAE